MAVMSQLIEQVRMALRYPHPTTPNRETVLQELKYAFQKMHNRLTNKAAAWSLESTDVCFSAGSDKGDIVNVRNVGVIQYVHTIPTSPLVEDQREILLVKPQNLDQFFNGPLNATGTEEHTAQVMAPYFERGQLYLMVRPVPAVNATYRLWFKPGLSYEPDGLAAEPPLPQFHPMIVADAARNLTYHCEWAGVEPDARAARIADITAAQEVKYAENLRDFEKYIASLEVAQPRRRRAFGEDDYEMCGVTQVDVSQLWR